MKKLLLAVLVLVIVAVPASARVIRVPAQYSTIQAAMDAAVSGDVVSVDPGVYDDVTHQCSPSDTTKTVVILKSGVTLRGMGLGMTVIDPLGLGRGIYCEGVTNAIIEGITIRNAYAAIYGSGIYCYDGAAPQILDCEIKDCLDGAIIARNGSSPTIRRCYLTNNANKEGGGLFVDVNCSVIVDGCIIKGNQAPSGAGLFIRGGSTAQITGCVINENFVNLDNGSGGGLVLSAANATIDHCYITDNISTAAGGGLAINESTVTVTNSQIVGNQTTATYGPGGGLMIDFNSDVTVEDCLIARNSVAGTDAFSDGGGVRAFVSLNVVLRRCTIVENSAAGGLGGGISVAFCQNPVVVEKCIVAHSTAGAGLYCEESSSLTIGCSDVFGNAAGDALCGTDAGNNFSQNPNFCDLLTDNYFLQAGSPCLPGLHPNGAGVCDGSQIGAYGLGCAPLSVEEPAAEGVWLDARPNPFAQATQIRFNLPRAASVEMAVFDPAGRAVRVLPRRTIEAGAHAETWDGRDDAGRLLPSGVYFYQLTVDGRRETRRLVLAR